MNNKFSRYLYRSLEDTLDTTYIKKVWFPTNTLNRQCLFELYKWIFISISTYIRTRVCVCVRARACVCVCSNVSVWG